MSENAEKQDGHHRNPLLKKTKSYKPAAVPTAFKVLNGGDGKVQNYVMGEEQPMEFHSEERGRYHLAGIRHGTDFPGWEGKPDWLSQKFKDLEQRISGLSGFHKDSMCFIYHIVPWEGFIVCVEIDEDSIIPPDFVKITVPDMRYDVYTHTGTMSKQPETFERICHASGGGEEDEEIVHFEKYDGGFDFTKDAGSFKIYIPVKK